MQYMHRKLLQEKLSQATLKERPYCYLLYSAPHVAIFLLMFQKQTSGGQKGIELYPETVNLHQCRFLHSKQGFTDRPFSGTGEMIRLNAVEKTMLIPLGCRQV